MAAPNYEQVQSFGYVTDQLKQAAIDEFTAETAGMTDFDEIMAEAVRIAEKFSILGSELGAQWYDLCAELAGVQVEAAELHAMDQEALESAARSTAAASHEPTVRDTFNYYLQNVINESIRATGDANLWRDYERGVKGGRWARVPVGDTCAWCLMLASQGAWYVSEKSALGKEAGHYHRGCDCKAVYYADPESIKGYENLGKYKSMYYAAEDARIANARGREKYPEELAKRVKDGKALHEKREEEKKQKALERGEEYKENPWTKYNETLIVMRYQNKGLK